MVIELHGGLAPLGFRIGVIASRFNLSITDQLVAGARKALRECGVRDENVAVTWAPGALELPQAASRMAKSGRWDALVALGCVIRGETHHFDIVANGAAQGIDAVARETGVPIAFGVLTVDTLAQAEARSGGALGNRGADAAKTALHMANLFRQMTQADVSK